MNRLLPGGRGRKRSAVLLAHPALASKQKPAQVPKLPRAFNPFKRRYRLLTLYEKKQIVFMRFGSLSHFDGRIHHSYGQIERQLRIPYSTMKSVVDKFRVGGYTLPSLTPTYGRFKNIPVRLKRVLLSTELLQQWAPFTINERVAAIAQLWDHSMSRSSLQRFYHANGVKYRQAKMRYKHCITNRLHLESERKQMAILLGSLLCSQNPIIYMDETTIRAQDYPRRSWATRENPNSHYVDNDQMISITVFGAIGTCIPPTFMLADSTNYHDYYKFVRLVAGKVPADIRKPLWFFDGHPSHARKDSKTFAAKYFRLIQCVPYTCEFNSVESVWALFKRDIRKRLLLHPEDLDQFTFNEMVMTSLHSIPHPTINGVLKSNRRFLRGLLQE